MRPDTSPAAASPALHPLLAQQRLELRARWRRWRQRPAEAGFHALAILALTALAALALGAAAPRMLGVLDWLQGHAPLCAAVTAAFVCFTSRWQQRAFLRKACSRGSWLAALPVAADTHRHAARSSAERRIALTAAAILLCLLALASLRGTDLGTAERAASAALTLWVMGGVLLGLAVARALPALRMDAPDTSSRAGLNSRVMGWKQLPSWLGPLPEIAQLQRRHASRAWRGGRAWPWLLPLGLMVLAGEGARVLAGMLVLLVTIPWLRTVLNASAEALHEGERLLASTPRRRAEVCASAWRYPATRALLACGALLLALLLFGAPAWLLALAPLSALLACLLEIALMLRYPSSRLRQRSRLFAELSLLLVLAREGLGPVALPLAAGLIALHVRRAWRLP